MNTIWGIVPARAGSVGIKNKNIRMLGGKPLVCWVVNAALKSKVFEKIIVTSDIRWIKDIVGSEVIVKRRPKNLSGDDVPVNEVIYDLLSGYKTRPDAFAILQPTSPFLRVVDIKSCWLNLKDDDNYDSAQTIREVAHHEHAYNQRVIDNDSIKFAFPEARKYKNKQSKPKHYALGNLIMTKTEHFMKTKDFFGKSSYVEIPKKYCIDIDYEEDLEEAERIYYMDLI